MKGGTFFSGIDAPEVACPEIDWRWRAEIDPFANAVSGFRRPGVLNLGDMEDADFDRAEPADVVVFGSPCQSFSVAGKRLGLDDPRGNLALVALAAIGRLRPRWLVFENVPGLFSSFSGSEHAERAVREGPVGGQADGAEDRDFAAFLARLRELGYLGCWRVLDAQFAGVPQRRRRVFFVGYLGDWRGPAAVLFERESLRGDPAPRREAGQDPSRAVTARAGDSVRCPSQEQLVTSGLEGGHVARALNGCETAAGRHDISVDTFVAGTLQNNGKAAGSATQQDAESGLLVPEVADPIMANEARSYTQEGKSFRTRNLIPTAFDPTQITHPENRSNPKPEGPSPSLARGAHPLAVAFSCKDYAQDAGETAPTLRAGGHVNSHANAGVMPAVCLDRTIEIMYGVSHADAQKTGPDQALRALREAVSAEAFSQWSIGIVAALRAQEILRSEMHGGGIRCPSDNGHKLDDDALSRAQDCSAWTMRALWAAGCIGCPPQGWKPPERLAQELGTYLPGLSHQRAQAARFLLGLWRASEGLGLLREALSALQKIWRPADDQDQPASSGYTVRRLTPREAERLQGFPDDYTKVPYRGRPASQCADGPRYKALGNSMAVPVLGWILRRLVTVDAILNEKATA